jgi:hypothetical protein
LGVLRRGGLGQCASLVADRRRAPREARALDRAQRRARGSERGGLRQRPPADLAVDRTADEREHPEDHTEDERSPPGLAHGFLGIVPFDWSLLGYPIQRMVWNVLPDD